MSTQTTEQISRFEVFKRLLASILGVNEVLFLIGMAAFFYGASALWSLALALLMSGVILMGVAIAGIVYSMRGGK
jgi:hypothetical protein